MTREEALAIVHEFVKNEALVRHMLAVEAAMVHYADVFGEDPQSWALAGLLHDFDWEIHPTLERHPQDGAPILRARGVPEGIALRPLRAFALYALRRTGSGAVRQGRAPPGDRAPRAHPGGDPAGDPRGGGQQWASCRRPRRR